MYRSQIILILISLPLIAWALIGLYDSTTIEEIGTEMVPCVDVHYREFEDELCNKSIKCSKFAWFGNAEYKCSDYDEVHAVSETEDKK